MGDVFVWTRGLPQTSHGLISHGENHETSHSGGILRHPWYELLETGLFRTQLSGGEAGLPQTAGVHLGCYLGVWIEFSQNHSCFMTKTNYQYQSLIHLGNSDLIVTTLESWFERGLIPIVYFFQLSKWYVLFVCLSLWLLSSSLLSSLLSSWLPLCLLRGYLSFFSNYSEYMI